MEVEIIEDLNPHKDPDIIDLRNLDEEKEHNSEEQDKPNENKKPTFLTRSSRKIVKKIQLFKPMKWAYTRWKKGFSMETLLLLVT